MFKKAVKALSVILAAILVVTTVTTALAAKTEEKTTNQSASVKQTDLDGLSEHLSSEYPLIIIPGISQSKSYIDMNDNDILDPEEERLSGGLMFIDTSTLVWDAFKLLFFPLLFTLIAQRDSFGFTENVYKFAKKLFWTQESLDDGTTAQNIKTVTYDCAVGEMSQEEIDYFYRMIPMKDYADIIGDENLFQFCFPLLGNPVENGKALQEYIDFVKEYRGVDKVDLATLSLGGTVLTSWLDYEGADYSSVNKVVNVVSLLDGTTVMGDMFGRDFNLSDEYVYNTFFPEIMDSTGDKFLGYVLNLAIRFLPRKVFENTLTRLVDGVFETFLLNAPQFWAMIPSGKDAENIPEYDSMYGYANTYPVLAERYLTEKPILKAKTDRFYEAQLALEENLLAAEAAGVKIYNISGYNLGYNIDDYSFFGIVASTATTNSDALIHIQSTTLGATAVTRNTELPAAHIAAANPKDISPDKSLDLSTALFPDRTWVYKGQHHEVGRCDLVLELAVAIFTGQIDTVDSDPANYPQFNEGRRTDDIVKRVKEATDLLADPSSLPPGTEDELRAARDAGAALLARPIGGVDEAIEVTIRLKKAVSDAGGSVYVAPEENVTIWQKLLRAANDAANKTIGGKGFFD